MSTMNATAAQLAAQGVTFAAQETGGPGTNGGANVVGDGGHGHGLFQIDDRWHDFAKTSAAMDPAQNADYAAGMIAGNLRRYGGDVRKALSAYNAGSPNAAGTKTTWADGATLGYADSVLRHESQLEEAKAEGPATSLDVNALQNATLAFAPQACTELPAPVAFTPWRPPAGMDATGHSAGSQTDYDSYINGDDA
jgi:hypothetical protein